MKKLVIFDWDGTLMDSVAKIVSSVQLAAENVGVPKPPAIAIKQIIGLSLPIAIEQLFPSLNCAEKEDVIAHYKRQYTKDTIETPLFEGVVSLLEALVDAGVILAVATGKSRNGLTHVWQLTNTSHYFKTSRCGCEVESKPHPQMVNEILKELEISPNDAVMIGDTSFDMEMAMSAGVDRIGVSYGVHDAEVLQKYSPLAICGSIDDVYRTLFP